LAKNALFLAHPEFLGKKLTRTVKNWRFFDQNCETTLRSKCQLQGIFTRNQRESTPHFMDHFEEGCGPVQKKTSFGQKQYKNMIKT